MPSTRRASPRPRAGRRDAHHRGRLDQRRRAGTARGHARVARQGGAAELEGACERGGAPAAAGPGRLPPPPRRGGQRGRAPEEPARAPPGDRARHRGRRPGAVAAGLLLRVRRPPAQADDHQGAWGVRAASSSRFTECGMGSPARPASRLSTAMSAIFAGGMRRRRDVRHHQQVRRAEQRVVAGQRLGSVTSSAAPAISPSLSALLERLRVDHRPARGVHEVGGRLHPCERLRADQPARLRRERAVEGHEVGALEQLLERHPLCRLVVRLAKPSSAAPRPARSGRTRRSRRWRRGGRGPASAPAPR